MKQKIHATATALSFFRQRSAKTNFLYQSVQKLWQNYQAKLRHKLLAKKRLLRQKALKKEMSPQSGQWTDRFLKIIAIKTCGALYPFRHLPFSGCLLLLLVVVTVHRSSGQVKDLQVGDLVPSPPKTATFTSKNQPYLMLFISSGCKTFNAVLKETDSLAKKAELSIIAVTTEKPAEMDAEVREAYQGKTGVSWLMADEYWNALFPHRINPHLVWVDRKGKVATISYADHLDLKQFSNFKSGTTPNIPVKADVLDFDPHQPLMKASYPTAKSFYGMLQNYIPGVEGSFGKESDSSKGTVRTYILNFPVYRMYLMAFGKAFTYIPNRLVWEVKDQADYLQEKSSLAKRIWYQQNAYCYESVLPIHTPDSIRMQKLKDDLNHTLGMNSRLEHRKVKAWVLEKTGTIKSAVPQKTTNTLAGAQAVKGLQNATLNSFTSYYNWKPEHIPVVDETGYTGKVDLQLAVNDMEDLVSLNLALAPYHLRLVQKERNLEFIVFTEITQHEKN